MQPWFREVLGKNWGGTVRGAGVLDPDLVVAFHRSDLSGWHINLFTSGSAVDATGKRTAIALAIGVAIVLGIAIVFALVRAAVLTRGIRGLQAALEGLKGERPSVPKLSSGIKEVTAAKLITQRDCFEVADEAVQIHGGAGYMKEYDVERAARDARLGPIGGGTDEIMKEILAKQLGL